MATVPNSLQVEKVETLYSFRQEYCEQLINHMASGRSFNTFAARLKVTRATLYNWIYTYPEFKRAKEVGIEARTAFFEDITIDTVSGNLKSNATLLQFLLKNIDPENYKDKQEVEHKGNVNFLIDTGIKRQGDQGYQDWLVEDSVKVIDAPKTDQTDPTPDSVLDVL